MMVKMTKKRLANKKQFNALMLLDLVFWFRLALTLLTQNNTKKTIKNTKQKRNIAMMLL